jgi:hypothetical protein
MKYGIGNNLRNITHLPRIGDRQKPYDITQINTRLDNVGIIIYRPFGGYDERVEIIHASGIGTHKGCDT